MHMQICNKLWIYFLDTRGVLGSQMLQLGKQGTFLQERAYNHMFNVDMLGVATILIFPLRTSSRALTGKLPYVWLQECGRAALHTRNEKRPQGCSNNIFIEYYQYPSLNTR